YQLSLRSALPLYRPPADVAPAEALRPVDAGDRCVGARLRLCDRAAHRCDVEDTPTVGEELSALLARAGVEDSDIVERLGFIHAPDGGAFFHRAWIALCGHHHGQRSFVRPAHTEIFQDAVAGGQQGG